MSNRNMAVETIVLFYYLLMLQLQIRPSPSRKSGGLAVICMHNYKAEINDKADFV